MLEKFRHNPFFINKKFDNYDNQQTSIIMVMMVNIVDEHEFL